MEKHILVNYLGRKGGGMVYAYEMTKGLLENGYKVSAIIPQGIENIEIWKKLPLCKLYLLKTYNNNFSFITGTFRLFLKERKRIKSFFEEDKIDCIYIPMIQPWTGFVNKIFKKAVIFTTLHDPRPHPGSGKIMNKLYKDVTEASDEIILLSSEFIDYTSEHYRFSKEKIHVIPHGVFDYYSAHSNGKIKDKIDRSDYNFLFFGRITPYKGLNLLAEAYEKLYEENKNISLTVVGSGNFELYEKSFPIEKNILIVNEYIPDEDVSLYFQGKNIITVLPYTDATQSGVIPIAMKEKSLLIVTDTGALSEQVGYGKYALLCKPDTDDLAEKMKEAIKNSEKNLNIINSANTYISSLSWKSLSKKLGLLLEGKEL